MFKKLFSHTAIYGLAPQVSKIAGIFALPIITKHLSEIDFGVYGVITAIAGSIAVLANLGLNVILSNSFFKSPGQYKWAWRQIYGFLILWNFPFSVLLGLLLYFFIPPEASKDSLGIIILNVLPIVFFGPTSIIGTMYYQLRQKPFQVAIRSAIFGFISVGLNVLFIAGFKMGYMGWFWSICISTMLNQLSYWWPLNRKLGFSPIFNFKLRYIKNSLKISLPTVPHYYSAYLLDTSDRAVMKVLDVNTGDIGKYNAAYTVANLIQKLGIAAGQALGPMLNQAYKNKNEKSARSLIFVLQAFFLALTFLLSIWLKEIFYFLIKNKELSRVYPLGIVIVMAYNYRPMYFGANYRLMYNEKTKVLLKVTFIAGIVNVILNFILIGFFGYKMAAFTTFIALLYMGYAGYFLKEYKETKVLNYYPLLWLSLTIILTFAAYFLVELALISKVLISFSMLLVILFVIRKIRLS
ncbi:lipopolysaccharide biosynthesis protein [Olivibacter domesticus]|uniref:Membrane protein involved in the export of O-antigen and teichoic acid n=1 Tax=Olivibacter domesticus TaxID=407022 RepID=A0A1H7UY77_OLID1|nr:oligosaccharide flippase family protein [Olivibacter domesticus]SEM01477.1 Membrane protein involved in the export of O-antigen and teichoic acid [Olivibacter domesticus]